METNPKPASLSELAATSDVPVLAYFWAAWCTPCIILTSTVNRLEKEYEGKLLVVRINVDSDTETAAEYGILRIPMLMLLHKGQTLWWFPGALPYEHIRREVEKSLPR